MSTNKWALFSRLILIQALTIWVGAAHAVDFKDEFRALGSRSCKELSKIQSRLKFSSAAYCAAIKNLKEVSIAEAPLDQDGRSVDAKNWPDEKRVEIYGLNWQRRTEISRYLLTVHEVLGLAKISDVGYVTSTNALVQLGYILQAPNLEQFVRQTESNMSGVYFANSLKMWSKKKGEKVWVAKECQRTVDEAGTPQYIIRLEHFAKKFRLQYRMGCEQLDTNGMPKTSYVSYSDASGPFLNIEGEKLTIMNHTVGSLKNQVYHLENPSLIPDYVEHVEKSGRTIRIEIINQDDDDVLVKIQAELTEDITVLPFLIKEMNKVNGDDSPGEVQQ